MGLGIPIVGGAGPLRRMAWYGAYVGETQCQLRPERPTRHAALPHHHWRVRRLSIRDFVHLRRQASGVFTM
jgi:hypothetical protein